LVVPYLKLKEMKPKKLSSSKDVCTVDVKSPVTENPRLVQLYLIP